MGFRNEGQTLKPVIQSFGTLNIETTPTKNSPLFYFRYVEGIFNVVRNVEQL